MIVALPFCNKDAHLAHSLVKWIHRLGGCQKHSLVMVMDADVRGDDALTIRERAEKAFASVRAITIKQLVAGWPAGPNELFKRMCRFAAAQNKPFLWIEPDAIPLKPTWIDEIERAYEAGGKPYLGNLYASNSLTLPKMIMSGIGVYPATAMDDFGSLLTHSKAFDMCPAAFNLVDRVNDPGLIQHFWGENNLPPTFSERRTKTSPVNTFTIERNIKPESVLFHRCKDHSLIRILNRRMFRTPIESEHEEFIVVLQFWDGDAQAVLRNVQWMAEMGQQPRYDCLLAYQSGTNGALVEAIENAAQEVFVDVDKLCYPVARSSKWPAGPNHAFKCVGDHIHQRIHRPWLWMEYDAIPLKKDWLEQLQDEYQKCGMPFMGPIVPNMGHMNGVGVYPANFPKISPRCTKHEDIAWDYAMMHDMIDLCHDAIHLIQHCWGIIGGKPHYREGRAAIFGTQHHVDAWVEKGAVIFHRCKDGSLIQRLKERLPVEH